MRVLVPTVVAAAVGCVDLPLATEGRQMVEIRLDSPLVILGDTTVAVARVAGPTGARLSGVPLQWWIDTPRSSSGDGEVVATSGDSAWFEGLNPGEVVVGVAVATDDPVFVSEVFEYPSDVIYPPLRLSWESISSDTTITSLGDLTMRYSVETVDGSPLRWVGTIGVEVRPGGAVRSRWVDQDSAEAHLEIMGSGTDTLILRSGACSSLCQSGRVVVHVDPVPTVLRIPDWTLRATSLGDTLPLEAEALDARGNHLETVPARWSLVDPADSVMLALDSVTGRAVALANGEATVRATWEDVSGDAVVKVYQVPNEVRFWSDPEFMVSPGTRDTVRFDLLDRYGHPVETAPEAPTTWSTGPELSLVASGDRWVLVETVDVGRTYVSWEGHRCLLRLWCTRSPVWLRFNVIPEPDSVRALPPQEPVLTRLGSSEEKLLGDIFLPDVTYEGVELLWTALDPAVATVDDDGWVTALSDGTARMEGRMGASADTLVLTVLAGG